MLAAFYDLYLLAESLPVSLVGSDFDGFWESSPNMTQHFNH